MAKEKETKSKRPTALKRLDQNEKRRQINRAFNSRVHTAIRHFETALTSGNENDKTTFLKVVYSLMDKGVKRGVYKPNKASRTKSRLTKRLNGIRA